MGSVSGKWCSFFVLYVNSLVKSNAEYDGVNRFLKYGAQKANFGLFGPCWGPKQGGGVLAKLDMI